MQFFSSFFFNRIVETISDGNGLFQFSRLPDDIWLVDLDSNKLTAPSGEHDDIPALPEPEGTILKNHLKQVTKTLSNYRNNNRKVPK